MGCSRKNPHPPDGWDSGNSRGRGGRRLRKSRREGGLTLKKSSAGIRQTHCWIDVFLLGVSQGIKETSVQMLKPEPGKCIDDSLQEVIRRYCVRTPAK